MYFKTLACICSIVCSVAAPAAYAAVGDDEAPSERVRLIDLNLRNEADAKIALRRISAAAASVCESEPGLLYSHCRAEAIRGAVAQAKAPLLSAMIAPKTRPAPAQLATR